jgi:hypothetical protein
VSEYADATCDLRSFREQLYACMKRRSDALFELVDAILTAGAVPSPMHLSLESVHRRELLVLKCMLLPRSTAARRLCLQPRRRDADIHL